MSLVRDHEQGFKRAKISAAILTILAFFIVCGTSYAIKYRLDLKIVELESQNLGLAEVYEKVQSYKDRQNARNNHVKLLAALASLEQLSRNKFVVKKINYYEGNILLEGKNEGVRIQNHPCWLLENEVLQVYYYQC